MRFGRQPDASSRASGVRDGQPYRAGSGVERTEWEVLLTGHHEGYLSWGEFQRNQRLIADNTNAKGILSRGAVRRGETLLAGLLRCALRPQAACRLQRRHSRGRPLSLQGELREPRRRSLYFLRQFAG